MYSIELGIEAKKAELEVLETQQDEIAIAGAVILSEVGTISLDGQIEFVIKKGRRSVQMKPGVDLKQLPAKFVTTTLAPNKNSILAAKPEELAAIAYFAEVIKGADKLTYKPISQA